MTVSATPGTPRPRPVSGSRIIDEAKVEAARFGRPGRTTTVGRRRPAVDKAFAAVIVDQQFADSLLRAVGGLRRQRGLLADLRRQLAAIDRERTGEDQPWQAVRLPERATGVEHGAGAVEIDPVAEIGVGLGLPADDRGQMEHRVRAGADQAATVSRSAISPVTNESLISSGSGSAGGALSNSTNSSTGPAAVPRSSSRIATRRPRNPHPPVITMRMSPVSSRYPRADLADASGRGQNRPNSLGNRHCPQRFAWVAALQSNGGICFVPRCRCDRGRPDLDRGFGAGLPVIRRELGDYKWRADQRQTGRAAII